MIERFTLDALFLAVTPEGSFDWTDFGPFGAAIIIAWFLLNRSDRVVESEKKDSERDLQRALDSLEAEKLAHEETRKLLYNRLHLEHGQTEGDPEQ